MEWEAHWHWWMRHTSAQWAAAQVEPAPAPEPTLWDIEKSANRLRRMTEKIESRRWLPTMANRVNGKALRELRAAHDLLREAGSVLTEVRE